MDRLLRGAAKNMPALIGYELPSNEWDAAIKAKNDQLKKGGGRDDHPPVPLVVGSADAA